MKRFLSILCATIALAAGLGALEPGSVAYDDLLADVTRPGAPRVKGNYVVFTANPKARHAGLAFEHEQYSQIHSMQRLVRRDFEGKETGSLLFFIAEVPPGTRELRYRMVIDGLWTPDPLNASVVYDYANGINVSTLGVNYYEVFQTNSVSKGYVRFTYEGKPGSVIRLAGTFNNWDPFMYQLTETSPGKHELILPLPRGTWYYAYYEGTTQLPDHLNIERVYTKDGRVASVVVVD
jgi:hypothetical protein